MMNTRIKINQAELDELLLLPGINLTEAQRIVNQRERIGGFISKDDFMDFLPVLGVEPHDYIVIKDLVEIEPLIAENARVIDF